MDQRYHTRKIQTGNLSLIFTFFKRWAFFYTGAVLLPLKKRTNITRKKKANDFHGFPRLFSDIYASPRQVFFSFSQPAPRGSRCSKQPLLFSAAFATGSRQPITRRGERNTGKGKAFTSNGHAFFSMRCANINNSLGFLLFFFSRMGNRNWLFWGKRKRRDGFFLRTNLSFTPWDAEGKGN